MRIAKPIMTDEMKLREIISKSGTYKECLEKMGIRSAGGNYGTLKKYITKYAIDISHFDEVRRVKRRRTSMIPLNTVLVVESNYSRSSLKKRLYQSGLKLPLCEMCGQGENWNGKKISLILDHINGIYNDNRIENLRILCPNCNATLDTHCGRNLRKDVDVEPVKKLPSEKRKLHFEKRRKASRPPLDELKREIEKYGYSATGRKYNVSDNAIRKWIRYYEKYNTVE
jgi:hypothetical protein